MATTSYPAFPLTWTPPSSCLASTAYNYAIYTSYSTSSGEIGYVNLFGDPTPVQFGPPSGPCLPPSYKPELPYATDGPCPTGYTAACATGFSLDGQPASSVTCCPSGVFNFRCNTKEAYGCLMDYTSGVTYTGLRTDFARTPPTGQPVTHTPTSGEGLGAWAIRLVSTPAAPTSTTTTNSANATTTPSQDVDSQAAGLSTGAKAGIGVGVSVGVLLLLGAGIVLFLRRRRRKQASSLGNESFPGAAEQIPLQAQNEYKPPMAPMSPTELYTENVHVRRSPPIELPGH